MMQRRLFSMCRVLQHDNPLVSISCSEKVMRMLTLLGPTSLRHPAVTPEPARITGKAQDSRCEEGYCSFVCEGWCREVDGSKYVHRHKANTLGVEFGSEMHHRFIQCNAS